MGEDRKMVGIILIIANDIHMWVFVRYDDHVSYPNDMQTIGRVYYP